MIKTTMKIDGMACSMCEAHVNDVIRKVMPQAQKIKSSHAKGESSFLSETEPDAQLLKSKIAETGYQVLEIHSEPFEKKRFLLRK